MVERVKGVYITRRGGYEARSRVVSFKIPETLLREIDELINRGYFQNRSDVMREGLRRLLSDYKRYCLGESGILGYR